MTLMRLGKDGFIKWHSTFLNAEKALINYVAVIVLYYTNVQVYWFTLILRLLWKILVMGEELEDNREIKEDGKIVNRKKKD